MQTDYKALQPLNSSLHTHVNAEERCAGGNGLAGFLSRELLDHYTALHNIVVHAGNPNRGARSYGKVAIEAEKGSHRHHMLTEKKNVPCSTKLLNLSLRC